MSLRKFILHTFFAAGILFPSFVFAGTGYIDAGPTNHSARLCSNTDCTSYTVVNWHPTNSTVTITDTGLSGYIWSAQLGWINLNPTNGGVDNTTSGVLSGYGWGQGASWVNFNPTNGGVTIHTGTGQFSGSAWVSGSGWMIFDCSLADACVQTSWRPTVSGTTGGGHGTTGGGGSTGGSTSGGTGGSTTSGGSGTTGTTTGGTTTSGTTTTGGSTSTTGGSTTTGSSTTGGTTTSGTTGSTTSGTTTGGTTTSGSTTGGTTTGGGGSTTGGGVTSGGSGGTGGGGWRGGNVFFGPDTPVGVIIEQITTSFTGTIDQVQKAQKQIQKVIETPTGNVVTQTVTSIGIVGGTAVTITSALFLNPLSFSELFLIPVRLWSLFLGAVGLAKRRRPWGTVYDSVTKQPLDPAYVILRSSEGEEIATTITDLDGRYGFVVPKPGVYMLVAHKTNYRYPSQMLVGQDHDEVYRDLYFGEQFTVAEAGAVIFRNIPMDPERFDWNEFAKKGQRLMKFYSSRDKWLVRLSDALFGVGFVVAAIAVISAPKTYNIVVFLLYSILFFIRSKGLFARPFGYVMDASTGYAIPYAIIRISSVSTGVEVMHRIADQSGRYYCLLPNGTYNIRVDRKLPDGTYKTVTDTFPITVSKGYLAKVFSV